MCATPNVGASKRWKYAVMLAPAAAGVNRRMGTKRALPACSSAAGEHQGGALSPVMHPTVARLA